MPQFFVASWPPEFSVNTMFKLGNKKRRGSLFLRAYPWFSGFRIAPISRISNASQPTPSDIIKFSVDVNHQSIKIATNSWDIIHPRERSVALPLWYGFKVAKFEKPQTGNVRKRPFPSACPTNGIVGLQIPSMLNTTRPCPFCPCHFWLRRLDWLSLLQIYEIFLNDIL